MTAHAQPRAQVVSLRLCLHGFINAGLRISVNKCNRFSVTAFSAKILLKAGLQSVIN
jgi:hypothetical protein